MPPKSSGTHVYAVQVITTPTFPSCRFFAGGHFWSLIMHIATRWSVLSILKWPLMPCLLPVDEVHLWSVAAGLMTRTISTACLSTSTRRPRT